MNSRLFRPSVENSSVACLRLSLQCLLRSVSPGRSAKTQSIASRKAGARWDGVGVAAVESRRRSVDDEVSWGRFDTVAAEVFGTVERLVGEFEEREEGLVERGDGGGDADADGLVAVGVAGVGDVHGGDGLADVLGDD